MKDKSLEEAVQWHDENKQLWNEHESALYSFATRYLAVSGFPEEIVVREKEWANMTEAQQDYVKGVNAGTRNAKLAHLRIVGEKDKEIEKLKSRCSESTTSHARLQQKIAENGKGIELKQKNTRIEELEQEAEQLRAKLGLQEEECSILNDNIEEWRKERDNLKAKVAELEAIAQSYADMAKRASNERDVAQQENEQLRQGSCINCTIPKERDELEKENEGLLKDIYEVMENIETTEENLELAQKERDELHAQLKMKQGDWLEVCKEVDELKAQLSKYVNYVFKCGEEMAGMVRKPTVEELKSEIRITSWHRSKRVTIDVFEAFQTGKMSKGLLCELIAQAILDMMEGK